MMSGCSSASRSWARWWCPRGRGRRWCCSSPPICCSGSAGTAAARRRVLLVKRNTPPTNQQRTWRQNVIQGLQSLQLLYEYICRLCRYRSCKKNNNTIHRRRIKTEEKSMVVAVVRGTDSIHCSARLFCTRMIWKKGWIHPILHIVLVNSSYSPNFPVQIS